MSLLDRLIRLVIIGSLLLTSLPATDTPPPGDPNRWTFSVDTISPTVVITAALAGSRNIAVTWSGNESGSGISGYDVQYKQGNGSWTSWLVNVPYTNATFAGTPGYTYTFQVQAADRAGNRSSWAAAATPVKIERVTKYYLFGQQRVAMRQGDVVYYLHGDHLGSTSLTTDASGQKFSESRYLPYGEIRWGDTGPTDFGFTGQRNESHY